jgi:hypothetical protein
MDVNEIHAMKDSKMIENLFLHRMNFVHINTCLLVSDNKLSFKIMD